MTQVPANWYDDGSGRLRYWDGSAWTEHFADTYVAPAQSAAPAQPSGFGPAQTYAAPAANDIGDLGYAVPNSSPADAAADPFAAPPRQSTFDSATSAPRKGLPGWAIALIIGGVVIIVGGVIGVVLLMANLVNTANDTFEGFEDTDFDSTAVPAEISSLYDDLDSAYRTDSCAGLVAVTTPNYLASVNADPDTCAGAFSLDEDGVGLTSDIAYWYDIGDYGYLEVYESYTEDGVEYGDSVEYTLVKVGDQWYFDSFEYLDY